MSRRYSRLAPFRAAVRFARRDAWTSKGRSALIMAMVAIPVAGLSGVALVGMSMVPSPAESVAVELGQADARIRVVNIPDPSLVQSPTNPDWFQIDRDENGEPVRSDASASLADPATLLPSGATLRALRSTDVTLTSMSATLGMTAVEGESWNAGFSPKYRITDGRAPRTDDEIMVTLEALDRLGVSLDGAVTLLPVNREVRVVGVLAAAAYPDTKPAAFGRLGAFTGEPTPTPGRDDFYLFGQSLDWSAVQQLNQSGAIAFARAVLTNPPPAGSVPLQDSGQLQGATAIVSLTAAGAAFAVLEVALLAGAAFMVGARQQQRMLATVASVGGHRRTLFQIVSASGLVLGLAGGIAGVVVGTAAGSLYMAVTADGSAVQYWGYHLSPPILLGIVAFAMLIGWIASLVPAVVASRMDVLAGLRGSLRPPAAPRRRRSVLGIAAIIVGVAGTAAGAAAGVASSTTPGMISNSALWQAGIILVLGGPVLAQVGLLIIVPRLLSGTSRAIARLGTGPRMAGRDIVRNRARSVPVVAAIMSTVFLGTMLLGYFGGFDESNRETYDRWNAEGQLSVDLTSTSADGTPTIHPVGTEVSTLLTTQLGATTSRVLSAVPFPGEGSSTLMPVPALRPDVKCDFGPGSSPAPCAHPFYLMFNGSEPHIWTGTVQDLALILDTDVSADAQRTLAAGGGVSLYPEYVQDDGTLRIDWVPASTQPSGDGTGQQPLAPARSVSVPAIVQKPEHTIHYGVFMLTATAAALDLGDVPMRVLAELPVPPDAGTQDQLWASLRSISGGDDMLARYENGPGSSVDSSGWALVAVAVLVSFAAAAVALGLARADGRRDDITLSSIGAGAGLRRTIAFWQAAILAGTGAILGGIVGLLGPAMLGLVGQQPFAPPWPQVTILLVALPLTIALGSWLVTRRARFDDLAQRTR